jgi:hypothetical protein
VAEAFLSLLDNTYVSRAMARGADLTESRPKAAAQKAWFGRMCPPALMEALDLDATAPQVIVDPTAEITLRILTRFRSHEAMPEPLCPVPANRAGDLVRGGLQALRDWDAEVSETVCTLVPMVLAVDLASGRAGGASLSDLPAVVWIRPGGSWRAEDAAESLLHEAVHQSLFLHDAVYGIFEEQAFVDPPKVPSAVRSIYPSNQEPIRTFWAAFHALFVAQWLEVWFRERKPLLAKQFERAIAVSRPHLMGHAELLTPLGRWLLCDGHNGTD